MPTATNNAPRSVLLAVDPYAPAAGTLRGASDLALRLGADLHIIAAYEIPRSTVAAEANSDPRSLRQRLLEVMEEHLTILPSSVKMEAGAPYEAILARASEVRADLIVLGPHKTRSIADRILGSTAERVLQRAQAPCMLLSEPLAPSLKRVLVPSDLSPSCRGTMKAAIKWGSLTSSEKSFDVRLAQVLHEGDLSERPQLDQFALHNKLLRLAEDIRVSSDIPCLEITAEVLVGNSIPVEIITYSEEIEADLLVMGTAGEGVLSRSFLGSISSAMIRRTQMALLLVPPSVWRENNVLLEATVAAA